MSIPIELDPDSMSQRLGRHQSDTYRLINQVRERLVTQMRAELGMSTARVDPPLPF